MLMMQGQSGYLGEMLNKWLQWAPGDGRRSRNFATYEDLREALLKVPGIASVAYDLGPVLGEQPSSQNLTKKYEALFTLITFLH